MSTDPALSQLPRIPVSLVRAAAPWKRAATATTVLPDVRAHLAGWHPDPGRLTAYRTLVGSSAVVPLAFPQVAVMAVHLDLISRWSFPIRAMGLIHLASDIHVAGELPEQGPWEVRAWIGGGRHVRSGLEFDLGGQVLVDGQVRWASRAVTLSRSRSAGGAEASAVPDVAVPDPAEAWQEPVTVHVGEDTGRSFGRVTGDVNPIHLHALSARAFGFSRAIAHGWWTTGRIAALLGADECVAGGHLRILFKRPVYLPSTPDLLVCPAAEPVTESGAEPGSPPVRRFALVAGASGAAPVPPDASPGSEEAALRVLAYGDIAG